MTHDANLLAAVAELLEACRPNSDASPAAFCTAVMRIVEERVGLFEIDGRRYLAAEQFRGALREVTATAREVVLTALPDIPAEVEVALDEAFAKIEAEVGRLTAPKPRH
jgi:hypothetical protein